MLNRKICNIFSIERNDKIEILSCHLVNSYIFLILGDKCLHKLNYKWKSYKSLLYLMSFNQMKHTCFEMSLEFVEEITFLFKFENFTSQSFPIHEHYISSVCVCFFFKKNCNKTVITK